MLYDKLLLYHSELTLYFIEDLGGVYTYTFSVKNEYFSFRFSLPFTPKR